MAFHFFNCFFQSILQTGQFKPIRDGEVPEEDLTVNSETEDSSKITTAIFYSITSTQKGTYPNFLFKYFKCSVFTALMYKFVLSLELFKKGL